MLSGLSGQAMPGWSDGKTVPGYGVIRLSGRFRFDHRTHRPGQKDAKVEEASSQVSNPLPQAEHLRSLVERLSAKVRCCRHCTILRIHIAAAIDSDEKRGADEACESYDRQVVTLSREEDRGGGEEGRRREGERRRGEERTDGRGRARETSR